jgi:hypothetical protein
MEKRKKNMGLGKDWNKKGNKGETSNPKNS